MSSDISKALTESASSAAHDDPRPPITARIQGEKRLKNRLRRQWKISRDPTLNAEANRLRKSVTYQLNEWMNGQQSSTLESLDPEDQLPWKMTRRAMKNPTPPPPLVTPGGLALSDSEKAEALADSPEAQFHPVNDPPLPAVIEVFNEAMRAYSFAPARQPNLSSPTEVEDAIRCLKFGKAPGTNGIPNRPLKHLPLSVVSLFVVLLNAIFRIQLFPSSWKHARVSSILKPGKNPALPSSYRPISLLDMIGKLFEILFTRIVCEVSGHGLLRNKQFAFRPKHRTTLQLNRLVECQGTSARRGKHARFSSIWLRPSILYGSTVSSTK
jgi:hypothetical protein